MLIVLPVAIPDFVVSFGSGFSGAERSRLPRRSVGDDARALTHWSTCRSPASLAAPTPCTKRSRGPRSRAFDTFLRVTIAECRAAAILGARSLTPRWPRSPNMAASEMLRYRTFTTTIFTEFHVGFDPAPPAAALAVLVLILVALLGGETGLAAAPARTAPTRARPGDSRAHVSAGHHPGIPRFPGVGRAALGVPIGTLGYWIGARATRAPCPRRRFSVRRGTPPTTARAWPGAGATLLAFRCVVSVRRRRTTTVLARAQHLHRAGAPRVRDRGARTLVFFSVHWVPRLYQTPGSS